MPVSFIARSFLQKGFNILSAALALKRLFPLVFYIYLSIELALVLTGV